jgi:5-(carboxyamino)imidazole ribonucleotide mutase
MPGGVPVATVAINGAKNAGILAAQIIATADSSLREQIATYKNEMKSQVDAKSKKLQKIKYKQYLSEMKK